MMKACIVVVAAFACLASACTPTFFSDNHGTGHRHLLAEGAAPWSYNRNGADWPGVCGTGKIQSPIAFSTDKLDVAFPEKARAKMDMGTAKGVKIVNTGHAVQLEWDSVEGANVKIPVVGNKWGAIFDAKDEDDIKGVKMVPVKPLQAHWHSTCEHLVDGEVCALELHIVTLVDNTTGVTVPDQCNTGLCLAVFGTKVNVHADPAKKGDATYQKVVDNLPTGVGKEAATELDWDLDLNTLLPKEKDYATYFGSLTAPPCSEGVHWHVFLDSKRSISAAQLDAFQAAMATTVQDGAETGSRTTNRQVMPLNGRTVFVSEA